VTEQNTSPREAAQEARREPGAARKRYEAPRLIDYGRISKLTQSGGITTKDQGSMERQGP
jgi:hypothetical protein